jgi:Ca-activated chloride channel homolog
MAAGNQAVAEKRFDTQDYDRASQYWLAREDIVLTNQGLLAYHAKNYPRAADLFRQVSVSTQRPEVKRQALYNLGRMFLELKEVERAADFFKEVLRLDPEDHEAKFNLERLYHFVLLKEGNHSEANLKQAPGAENEANGNSGADGQGRGQEQSGI